jgi:hypothetical protein
MFAARSAGALNSAIVSSCAKDLSQGREELLVLGAQT